MLVLSMVALAACAANPPADRVTMTERISAEKNWYCGKGMFGIRAVARFGLSLIGVPIPDLCKVVDSVIVDAKS